MGDRILKSDFYVFIKNIENVSNETVVKSLLKDDWYILGTYQKRDTKYYTLGYAPGLKDIFLRES